MDFFRNTIDDCVEEVGDCYRNILLRLVQSENRYSDEMANAIVESAIDSAWDDSPSTLRFERSQIALSERETAAIRQYTTAINRLHEAYREFIRAWTVMKDAKEN